LVERKCGTGTSGASNFPSGKIVDEDSEMAGIGCNDALEVGGVFRFPRIDMAGDGLGLKGQKILGLDVVASICLVGPIDRESQQTEAREGEDPVWKNSAHARI
jgi:hypothetical protein